MVGVAGKSKGCNTCRQRRIKCGLERPHCAQCLKSNFRCAGYQRERIFVVNDSTSMKCRQVPSAKRTVSSGDRNPKKPARTARDKRPSAGRMIRGPPPKIIIQASPSPHASYRLQLLSEFLKSYIPVEQLGPLEDRPWFLLVPTLPSITRALEVTTMAVCTAKLGRLNKNQAMISDSLQFYTQGLSEVQKALWDPALMYSDETLAASMALAMYELTECPAASKVGYISHHKGCVRLVQLRGPEAHTSGLAHQVFLTFRIQAILDALEPHHSTYLSDEAWMDRPWRERPKRPMDVLFDHLAQVPAIFNQVQALRSLQPHEVLAATLQIITKCWEMDDGLRLFYDNLESSSLGPLYWPEFSKLESIFPVAFHFSDLNTANMLMLYWTTLTMLWSGLSKLYGLLSSLVQIEMDSGGIYDSGPSYHVSRLRPLDHRVRYISMARNACQSVEYCVQDQMLGFGPSTVVAPLTILTETLRDDRNFADEMLWIKETLKTIDTQGIKILSHL